MGKKPDEVRDEAVESSAARRPVARPKTLDQIRREAMQLGTEERSWLAEELFDSLKTDDEREIEQGWLRVAERRIAEIDAGTAVLISADEVFRELKAKYAPRGRRLE